MKDADLLKAMTNIDDDILAELLKGYADSSRHIFFNKKRVAPWKIAIAAAILLPVLVLTGFAVANAPIGWWFLTDALSNGETYILDEYWLAETGLIAEDKSIRIETVGALQDGDAVMVGILTTVKQVDSAIIEGSNFPIYGYCFDKIDVFLESQQVNVGRFRYTYADGNPWLQENQFLMVYSCDANWEVGSCLTIALTDLGYIGSNGQFALTERGEWTYSFKKEDLGNKEMPMQRAEKITINGAEYAIQSMSASIFGVQMTIKPVGATSLDDLVEALGEVIVVYEDGTERPISPVVHTGLRQDEFAWDGTYRVSIEFNAPTPLEQIRQIEIFDGEIILGK